MDKIEGKDILNSAAIVANGIMNNLNGGISFYNNDRIKEIWDLALQTVMESVPKVNTIYEDTICDGDLVVLRIDANDVERFNLVKFMGRLKDIILPADTMRGHPAYKDNQFRFINTCSGLGSELLGKKVGDRFNYYIEDKDHRCTEHIIEVMSFKRTPKSNQTNRCEVAADITLYKEQQEKNEQKSK